MAAISDVRSIFADDLRSIMVLYFFHVQITLMNILGIPSIRALNITPIMPSVGIKIIAIGMPIARVSKFSFM